MTQKETIKSLNQSNESFCNAIENNSIPLFDANIQIELMILYLRANITIIRELNLKDIEDIALNSNYIIHNNVIIYNNTIYSPETLKEILERIHSSLTDHNKNKIIAFSKSSNTFPKQEHPLSSKILKLKTNNMTFNERGEVFERTISLNQDTRPYIYEVKTNYLENLYKLINISFNQGQVDIEPLEFYSVASLLRLYSLIYLSSFTKIIYQDLNIPQNAIALRVPNYQDPEVLKINQKTYEILAKKKRIETRLYSAQDEKTKTQMHRLSEYYRRLVLESMIESYFIQTEPEIYNKNLIDNIISCLNKGYFDINFSYLNPLVRIFNIEKGKVTFICTMHLSIFYNIVNNKNINKQDLKKLEYKNE